MKFVGAVRFSRTARYANTVSLEPRVVSRSSKETFGDFASLVPLSAWRNNILAAFFAALDGVAEM